MARVRAAGRTEQGPVRKSNDDAFRIYDGEALGRAGRGHVFAVADGIGSYRAGGQAAAMAVDQLALYFQYPPERFSGDGTFENLIFLANDAITSLRTKGREYYGMGCTLTTLLTDPQLRLAIVYQIGDSMAYLLRDDRLSPVTIPQSDAGELANHLGIGGRMHVEKVRFQPAPGDSILLCTDGMSGVLSPEEMRDGLVASDDPRVCLDALVERALETSTDNVTAVVVKVV